MFDNPGKKLNQLKDELLAIEEDEGENIAVNFDDALCEDELEEPDAVFAAEPRRAGLRTLALLLIIALGAAAAGWWFGWL